MAKSITPNQIKENNRILIYQYIYDNKKVSQIDISYHLHLSRPTVAAKLAELEEKGLVKKAGQIPTEFVGRKASAYKIVENSRVGIGVEILQDEIKIAAVNLYGREIHYCTYKILFKNEPAYFQQVCQKILDFKSSLSLDDTQILGIGFAMQALISPDSNTVSYGKILNCTGLSINAFADHLPFPCSFIHDADSAAVAELWASPDLQDAFYLSISRHLGAALIAERKLLCGDHGHNSTVEHIVMEPNGVPCYCGKTGCMETLCSLNALLGADESITVFFERVRAQQKEYVLRWNGFLKNLARVINLLHLVYDKTFILGGYLAPYLTENDLCCLYEEIKKLTPFPEASDFLLISKVQKHSVTIGASLQYIQNFLEALK